jgi:Ferric uptake regulator family
MPVDLAGLSLNPVGDFEQLTEFPFMVQALEAGTIVAGIEPSGQHHHHAICRECGRMIPFEDASLERAIDEVSGRMSFDAAEHEVTIRRRCERCAGRARPASKARGNAAQAVSAPGAPGARRATSRP